MMSVILIIAGFDPCGGAGLQADLKTVTVLGGVGLTVVTALTIQNTQGVKESIPIDKENLKKQIDVLCEDFKINAVKIGMLPNEEIVKITSEELKRFSLKNLVIDPVIKAKNKFLLNQAVKVMLNCLFPLADLITPNIDEVGYILGKKPLNVSEMKEAALKLKEFGPKAVLITGGELSPAMDVLYDGHNFYVWETTKKQNMSVHGTGCVFSSAIATFLSKGFSLLDAVIQAKKVITLAIDGALALGKGSLLSHPFAYIEQEKARYEVIEALKESLKQLQKIPLIAKVFPEVRMNFVYALPYARSLMEVAGFPGRLTVINGKICAFTAPTFGVSHHMANIVLKAMEFDKSYRAAINIKFSSEIVAKAKALRYKVEGVSRTEEPPELKEIEGVSLPWLVEKAIKKRGSVPDLIYDKGDWGKEPMIRILGKNPYEVVEKLSNILKEVFKYG